MVDVARESDDGNVVHDDHEVGRGPILIVFAICQILDKGGGIHDDGFQEGERSFSILFEPCSFLGGDYILRGIDEPGCRPVEFDWQALSVLDEGFRKNPVGGGSRNEVEDCH